MRNETTKKIDPDPFTLALSIFGAIGTLATIADYYRGGRNRTEDDERRRRKATQELS